MFERFTERARSVVVSAQGEARGLGHHSTGPEHLLLGLLGDAEGLGARVLLSAGLTAEPARRRVLELAGAGADDGSGQIPFTGPAKQVLELSLREALALGHNSIGSEHILLALAGQTEGVAARILREAGADAETVRGEVLSRLPEPGGSKPSLAVRAGLAAAGSLSGRPSDEVLRVPGRLSGRPSDEVLRVLMAAGRCARETGRAKTELGDLLIALARDSAGARLLARLGVDEAAVRRVIDPERGGRPAAD